MSTVILQTSILLLEPQACSGLLEMKAPAGKFRARKLIVKAAAQPPEMNFFNRKVRGSARKGRQASNLFFAHLLAHDPNRPDLLVTNIQVDQLRQTVGGPIPVAFFAPEAYDMELSMDLGRVVRVEFVNNEKYRRVSGVAMIFGNVYT